MIRIRKNIVTFTGKHARILRDAAKRLGMSEQDTFTGMMWETVMECARKGVFQKGYKHVRGSK